MNKKHIYTVCLKPLYLCNQTCLTCPYPLKERSKTMSWNEVQENLSYVRDHFIFERIDLNGGEPFLYPDIWQTLDWCRENLPDTGIYIATNGIALAEAEITDRLAAYDLHCVVSYHAPEEETSRVLTGRKGHYDKLVRGLENLSARSIPFSSVTVLTRQNQEHIGEIISQLVQYPTLNYLNFKLPSLKNNAHVDIWKPDIAGLVERVAAAFDRTGLHPNHLSIGGFPDCLHSNTGTRPAYLDWDYEMLFIDRDHQCEGFSDGGTYESAIAETAFYQNFIKEPQCSGCQYNGQCRGIDKVFLKDLKQSGGSLNPVLPE